MPLDNIAQILLILSGKGGVGKSSVTLQLALSLTSQGHNVGILDIDLTGPSIPRLLGLEDRKVTQAPGGWLPVEVHPAIPLSASSAETGTGGTESGSSGEHEEVKNGISATANGTITTTQQQKQPQKQQRGSLHALSLAFLLPSRSSAVIWRGPKKTAMIRQFVSDVLWPPGTDYLLIDTPPGTSDEHIAIVEELHKLASINPGAGLGQVQPAGPELAGAVVVTTPQAISVADVRKEINFCVKTQVPVIGVIENMSGYMCPCCDEITHVFSKGGGEVMSREMGVRFLGGVPVDTGFVALVEGVKSGEEEGGEQGGKQGLLVERYAKTGLAKVFEGFARVVVEAAEGRGAG